MSGIDEQANQVRGTGGASMNFGEPRGNDPRFTALIQWALPLIGLLGITLLTWIGSNVISKLDAVSTAVTRMSVQMETQADQTRELKAEVIALRAETTELRSKVYMIEGRALRGIASATRDIGRGN